MHALPFADAPIVGALQPGESRLALADITAEGGRWVAVQSSRYDRRAYVSRPDVDLRSA